MKQYIKICEMPDILYNLVGITRTRTCIYEWIRVGRINSNGERIRLRTIKRFGFLYTTFTWVKEFVESL